jgi:hypothetical protein
VSERSRTRHYRTLAGHLRLWAEASPSSDIMERLRSVASQLDELATDIDAAHRLPVRVMAEAESPAA